MFRFSHSIFTIALLLYSHSSYAHNEELIQEAREIVKQFAGRLKPALKSAIQSGGLTHAVEVCAVEAPKISESLSVDTGWQVRRVSLKPRNSRTAIADNFERSVLLDFEQQQAQGAIANDLHHAEQVDGEFRYMQAQGVEPVCLNCHGEHVQEPVHDRLKRFYPDDLARGYALGQIRGAISLKKTLKPKSEGK